MEEWKDNRIRTVSKKLRARGNMLSKIHKNMMQQMGKKCREQKGEHVDNMLKLINTKLAICSLPHVGS